MIAHQTIMKKLHGGEALLIAADQVQEVLAVLAVGQHRFAVMPAVHEVVAGGRRLLKLAWRAGHDRRLSRLSATVSRLTENLFYP